MNKLSILTDKIWSPTRRPATWAALPFLIAFANIPTAFPPVTWIPRLFPIRWNDTRCGSLKHKIKLNIIYYVLLCNEVNERAKDRVQNSDKTSLLSCKFKQNFNLGKWKQSLFENAKIIPKILIHKKQIFLIHKLRKSTRKL